mmetsp:Transcript_45236/g.67193  ORF Transcript_45236/g.67193 Transcript_45236/m.67193 type:complete len:241 (-) Transcript_45236:1383-2105(-)
MDGFGQIIVHLPYHRQYVMIHCKSVVFVHITESLDHGSGHIHVILIFLALRELFQSCGGHPLHLFLSNGREAVLRTLHLTNCGSKGRRLAVRFVDEVREIPRIICGSKSVLQRHNRVARLLSSDVVDLTEHQIFNVRPFHSEVKNISLHIHSTTASSALHLKSDERGQFFSHISTENTCSERHVDAVSERSVGKNDSKTSFLRQHLHLTTVARETDFIRVDGNPTTKTANESMVDINFFS